MTACIEQTSGLPARELIEVRMTDLESNPLATLESIYRQLELPGFDTASARFTAYLEKIGAYRKNRLSLSDDERSALRLALAHVFGRFGYG